MYLNSTVGIVSLYTNHYAINNTVVIIELGLTGIPVFNTNNNCSSASSALMLARALVLSGYDCTIAIGKFCVLIHAEFSTCTLLYAYNCDQTRNYSLIITIPSTYLLFCVYYSKSEFFTKCCASMYEEILYECNFCYESLKLYIIFQSLKIRSNLIHSHFKNDYKCDQIC